MSILDFSTWTGKVGSLFREKNQVKQVNNGQECGIALKDYMDFKNLTLRIRKIGPGPKKALFY